MKTTIKLVMTSFVLGLMAIAAFAGTTPEQMHVSCTAPNPDHQEDLHRPKGDGNIWTFQIVLDGDAHFVTGPYWSYPGKGGTDPDWGLWTGGADGNSSLGWSSPGKTGSFQVRVSGQISCGNGGGGKPIDFSAGWDGDVQDEINIISPTHKDEYDYIFAQSISFDCDRDDLQNYSWDWGDNQSSQGKSASHTYQTAGEYTVTVTANDDDHELSDSVTVYIIGGVPQIVNNWQLLHYYCGQDVPSQYNNFPLTGQLNAPEQPEGTQLEWNTSSNIAIVSGQGGSQIILTGSGPSDAPRADYVEITYSRNDANVTVEVPNYTVIKPQFSPLPALFASAAIIDLKANNGYNTQMWYSATDQFQTPMAGLYGSESFGTFQANSPNNWPTPQATGGPVTLISAPDANGQNVSFQRFVDNYFAYGLTGLTPPYQNPQNPLGTTKVMHADQKLYLGAPPVGSGCVVAEHTAQYYTDHGRPE